jgi:hypothetical protein
MFSTAEFAIDFTIKILKAETFFFHVRVYIKMHFALNNLNNVNKLA